MLSVEAVIRSMRPSGQNRCKVRMQSHSRTSPICICNLLKIMVSRVGLEPATTALKGKCSTRPGRQRGVASIKAEGAGASSAFGGRSVYGSLTGTAIDQEDTLAFSALENIRPMIETVPLEQAADAYARMMQGKARFRMVLVTKDGAA